MEGKRLLKRRELISQLAVVDVDTGDAVGRIVDVTAEGFALVSPARVPEGRAFSLEIALPEPAFGRSSVRVEAQSVWCRPDESPDLFLTGFRIAEASAPDIHALVATIVRQSMP